jgi:hypothetical protein
MELKNFKQWEWQTYLTLVVLVIMIIGWFTWASSPDTKEWAWKWSWWLGFSTLLGHFIAGITD